MKQYLLFSFDNYYPSGGFNDYKKDFDSHEEALSYIKETYESWHYDFYQIVDMKSGTMDDYHSSELFEVEDW